MADYPIGGIPTPPSEQGYLYATFLDGVVKSADPSIYNIVGIGADIALSAGEVPELTNATTFLIRQISTGGT